MRVFSYVPRGGDGAHRSSKALYVQQLTTQRCLERYRMHRCGEGGKERQSGNKGGRDGWKEKHEVLRLTPDPLPFARTRAQDGTGTHPEPGSAASPGTCRSTINHSQLRRCWRVPRATARSRGACVLVAYTAVVVVTAVAKVVVAALHSRLHRRKQWNPCPRLSTRSCSPFGVLTGPS